MSNLGPLLNPSLDLPLALGEAILGDRQSKRDKEGEEVPEATEAPAGSPLLPSPESQMQERGSIVFLGPRRLAILTAALEDLGVSRQDGFGFKLAFGHCVSDGDRQSEFTVEGLGLAALSRYLAQWFRDNEKGDFPLQVVDEGLGELKIFISAEE
ncbi:MAG: hypothetical protein HYX86_06640 [Chloroflexi bacterium]|nr:hypothetical protein [Chloroflexota bacterium]